MSRLFISGDWHGNQNYELFYLKKKKFPEQKLLTKEDVLIQLGDFGFCWFYKEISDLYKKDLYYMQQLAQKKFSILIIPGNHENYDIINNLPIINKWGGKVYVFETIKGCIYFAIRGEIYTINDKRIFTFSGATSLQEDDRFSYDDYLSKKDFKKKKYRYNSLKRIIYEPVKLREVNFWKQEVFTSNEKDFALKNLEKYNFKVDFVCSHTAPADIIKYISSDIKYKDLIEDFKNKEECKVSQFFNTLYNKINFNTWFFGHLHISDTFIFKNKQYICHYNQKPLEI